MAARHPVQPVHQWPPASETAWRKRAAQLGKGGYEQLEWRRDRTPGVASYFSSFDAADVGGQRAFLPGGVSVFRARDATPDGFDPFGVALRYASGVADLGLYALRYNSKSGFLQTADGAYHLVFPRGIEAVGVSAYAGDSTLPGEVSVRRHMPLVSQGFSGVSGSVGPPAFGQTLLVLAFYQRVLPTGRLWQGCGVDGRVVDEVTLSGKLVRRVASHGVLNAPWGMAIAPTSFGAFSNALLVGNFGDGRISAFRSGTGAFLGQMITTKQTYFAEPGLWAILPGNGGAGGAASTLYFTAGIQHEAHGLFGSLSPAN